MNIIAKTILVVCSLTAAPCLSAGTFEPTRGIEDHERVLALFEPQSIESIRLRERFRSHRSGGLLQQAPDHILLKAYFEDYTKAARSEIERITKELKRRKDLRLTIHPPCDLSELHLALLYSKALNKLREFDAAFQDLPQFPESLKVILGTTPRELNEVHARVQDILGVKVVDPNYYKTVTHFTVVPKKQVPRFRLMTESNRATGTVNRRNTEPLGPTGRANMAGLIQDFSPSAYSFEQDGDRVYINIHYRHIDWTRIPLVEDEESNSLREFFNSTKALRTFLPGDLEIQFVENPKDLNREIFDLRLKNEKWAPTVAILWSGEDTSSVIVGNDGTKTRIEGPVFSEGLARLLNEAHAILIRDLWDVLFLADGLDPSRIPKREREIKEREEARERALIERIKSGR